MIKLKAIIISISATIFILVGILEGAKDRFYNPNIPDGEKTVYKVTEGRDNFEFTYEIQRKQNEGKPAYLITSATSSSVTEMLVSADDMKPISIQKIKSDGDLEFKILYRSNRVHFIHPGPERNRVEKVPDDSYDLNIMMQALRGFPFQRENKVDFTLVTEDHVIGVYAKFMGTEEVNTPLGFRNCYKLEAGISGLKGKIITYKFYFWYNSAPPHRLIKYYDTKDQRTILMINTVK